MMIIKKIGVFFNATWVIIFLALLSSVFRIWASRDRKIEDQVVVNCIDLPFGYFSKILADCFFK